MASSNNNFDDVPSPNISDVMSCLKDILEKLKNLEEDNQKLRQELLKRTPPETEEEIQNEQSSVSNNNNNKRARRLLPSACFDNLDDHCLDKVFGFVGERCYIRFALVNKRCHEMFCSKGLQKVSSLYGYGPLEMIHNRGDNHGYVIGFIRYHRQDILLWSLIDATERGCFILKKICCKAIHESRLHPLRVIFDKAHLRHLRYLRDSEKDYDLCYEAACHGKLEILGWLKQNKCNWNEYTWKYAKQNGHEHILEYLRDNGYPSHWQR